MNFPLPTVSLLPHLQILHLTFNAILPNCPVLYSKSLSFASTCLYRINLFSPAHVLRVPLGQGCVGLQILGDPSEMQLADRQEKENKQVQEVGRNELVEARGGK